LDSEAVQFTHGDDITVRLTRWCEQFVDRAATQKLMDEAAREIERLRLTDDELDAIEHGLERLELHSDTESQQSAVTLRLLLERLQ
jgi:hypothetical protein